MIREIKQTFTFSESRFRNFQSDFRIVTITQHSNHLFASRTLQNRIYLSIKSALVLCLDDNFNNISSHNFTSQNTQSVLNIYIIISIEESFEIFIYFLANSSSFSIFAISTMHCSEAQTRTDFEIAKVEFLKTKQRLNNLRERRVQRETIEIAKSISTFRDIDIFDSTLICDIQEFELYSQVTSFLQHLEQCQHQYRKSDVLDLLFKCLRDFAFAWFKTQLNFIYLQNFDKDLASTFFVFIEFVSIESISIISTFSIEYHNCFECFAIFSSMSRLLQHTQFHCTSSQVICKHCDANFNFKNKFHEHIREQHTQKSNIISNFRFFTSEFIYKFKKKSTIVNSSISFVSSVSFIFLATSRSQIFYFATIFKSMSSIRLNFSIALHEISSKRAKIATMLITRNFTSKRVEIVAFNCSFIFSSIFSATSTSISESISSKYLHLFIATRNITSKSMKKLSINSFAFSTSFSRTSVRKHQEFHVQKSYFIIDDLIRMFREKSKSLDLHSHRKCFVFSQRFDIRSFNQSRFFYQSRIIVYFMFAVNQKTRISQNLKNSNSKNFQQFTSAKTIRFVLSKKSIFSSYKMTNIFYISLQSKFSSRFSFVWFRFTFTFSFAFSFTSSSFFRFRISNHVCCICFDHFNFLNDLFNYSNFNQSYFSNRRSMREMKKMISRFETKLKKNEK